MYNSYNWLRLLHLRIPLLCLKHFMLRISEPKKMSETAEEEEEKEDPKAI